MDQNTLYRDIAGRCGGDIYIGVVGPVRTGKSSFIKRFMELMVMPGMGDGGSLERMRDELPQSGAGRTIMTTQPKFVPNEAVELKLKDGAGANVRLVDCVGYMVPGALGAEEDREERMVRTPWFDHDISFEQAAEIGTRKVIADHSTIGVVVTTDGSVADIPRSGYEQAEARVVSELKALDKPFIVVLNCREPSSRQAKALAQNLEKEYGVPVHAVNVLEMDESGIAALMESLLFEFPLRELRISAPSWLSSLDEGHWLGKSVLETLRTAAEKLQKVRDCEQFVQALSENEYADAAALSAVRLNDGSADVRLNMKDGLFYKILGEACGQEIDGEEHLFELMKKLVESGKAYDRLASAVESVEKTGYGVVLPSMEEMELSPPQLSREGGHYGVRLHAKAPSVHMVRVDLNANVSPMVGTEKQSKDLADLLTEEYQKDPSGVWATEVFGKPLRDLVRDEMSAKLLRMPDDVRRKLGLSLGKIVNEGSGGMICILL